MLTPAAKDDGAGIDASNWNSLVLKGSQQQIIQAFRQTGEIMKIFEAGARLRNQDGFPGRMYMVGHAMREVINRLPDYYEGIVPDKAPRLSPEQIHDLFRRWNEAVGELFVESPDVPPKLPAPITLSYNVGQDVHSHLSREAAVSDTRRERFAAFLGRFHEIDPALMQEIAADFVRLRAEKFAHLPDPPKQHNEQDALALWDRFEGQLYSLCGPRHDIYSRIDSDIEELNAL